MYYVKFYKKDKFYIYLVNKESIVKFLTFAQFINYVEENNIPFDKIKFNMNLNDLFYHFVNYESIKRVISYNKFEDKKKYMLKEINKK